MPAVRTQHFRNQTFWMVLLDLICLLAGSLAGIFTRFQTPEEMERGVFEHIHGWLLLAVCVIVANYITGNYRLQYTYSRFNLMVSWLFSMFLAVLILSLTSYASLQTLLGRGVLALSMGTYGVVSLVLKMFLYKSLFGGRLFMCRAVLLGAGRRAEQMRALFENSFVLPAHKVVALVVVDGGIPAGQTFKDGIAVIHTAEADFENLVKSLDASMIGIALDDPREAARIYPRLRRLRYEGVEVLTPLGAFEIFGGRTPLDLVDEDFIMQVSMESEFPVVRRVKRMIDVGVAVVLGVLLLVPMLLIALLQKLTSPLSPVFYSQDRVGQFGRIFRIYKFRTMAIDAEKETGPVWSGQEDGRITRFGAFLRAFRLDELPQLWNILKADMSLVGPRPERPEIVKELEQKIPFYAERENVVPGLTGWAQIRYPYGNSIEDSARKLEYDLYYMKYLSLSLDLQILLSTLRIVVLRKEKRP